MAQIETWYRQDLKQPVQVHHLPGNVFSQDNQGNLLGVEVYDDGVPASLSGTVSANIVRSDGGTVAATGTVSGNKMTVVLPAAAYAVPGIISVVLKLVAGGITVSMLAVVAVVYASSTDSAVDPGTIIPSISALIEQIQEAVATIPLDYSDLNSFAEEQINNKICAISPNMYNKNVSPAKSGYYATSSGWTSAGGDSRLGTTHPIYLIEGNTYKWPANGSGIYGVNAKYAWRIRYPGDSDIIDMTNIGTLSDGYYTVAINTSGWYVVNIDLTQKNAFMFCDSSQYPDFYIGYGIAKIADDYPNVFLTFEGDEGEQYLSVAKKSANMFDRSSSLIQSSQYCSGWDWAESTGDARLGATHPIYLVSGQTYKWIAAKGIYGANNGSYLWRVTSLADLTIISRKQGEFSENDEYVTWTCDETGYWVVDIDFQAKDAFMFCLSSEYPSNYEEYGVYYATNALDYSKITTIPYLPIAGKTLVCDGDSIAAASYDMPQGKGGWFGRLRDDQKIVGHNYAIGGGSITYLSDSRHCISRSIDDIYDDYESIDILILEGGTNDADLIGQFVDDTPPEGFGTWTADDFSGEYDDTTFCGAVEAMFYKALNYWPSAHIGFIVAMEMGYNNNASTNNRKRYFDEIVKIAEKWHIPVLNLWNNSGADARLVAFYDPTKTNQQNVDSEKFYYDGQHPTSYGYNKMQRMIEEWVKGL